MSQALRDVLSIMFLIQEIKSKGFQVICTKPYIYCKVFEDSSGALELARLLKLCSRTKHINMCCHHFCKHVRNGLINGFPIGTKDQTADVLTKLFLRTTFNVIAIICKANEHVQATIVRECAIFNNVALTH